jgi:threonine dehydratase
VTALEFADVAAAAERLEGKAVRTPLLQFPALDDAVRGRVLLKVETLQIGGSFKFRGAFNRLSRLSAAETTKGVVAWSSGNHAQGVAHAANKLGIAATIVMPGDAPRIKTDGTRALGARIVSYDRFRDDREAIARKIAADSGAVVVPSYDDPHIIAGQGTVGLELIDQAAAMGAIPDAVYVPCSGGGLVSGSAVAIAARSPKTKTYAVEPSGFDDTTTSLAAGRRLTNTTSARSICDALLAPMPGELTFPLMQKYVAGGVAVTDEEVKGAVRFAFRSLKLVVEPGGAVALAAILAGKVPTMGKSVAVVLSGGNVDPETFAELIR